MSVFHNCMDAFGKLFWLRSLPTHVAQKITVVAFDIWNVYFLTKVSEIFEMVRCEERILLHHPGHTLWLSKCAWHSNSGFVYLISMFLILNSSGIRCHVVQKFLEMARCGGRFLLRRSTHTSWFSKSTCHSNSCFVFLSLFQFSKPNDIQRYQKLLKFSWIAISIALW